MPPTIHIQKTLFKVSDFVSWQKAGSLVLSPEFQRRPVWQPGAKSYLIDTMVRGFPIPIIFLRDKRVPNRIEPIREVVDGQQRLRTVLGFISPDLLPDYNPKSDEFTVKRTHNTDMAGKAFNALDQEIQDAILDYEFVAHVLPSVVSDREVIQIFRRMNSTNYTLTMQERRNSEYFGEFKTSAYTIAAEQIPRWRKWKTFSETDISRMSEVEHTSECMITMMNHKLSGKSAANINRAYKVYDEEFADREGVEYRFRAIMDSIDKNFSPEISDFVMCDKKVIYTFFTFLYDLQFGLDTPLSKSIRPRPLRAREISQIKLASTRIKAKTTSKEVWLATDRRTTNPKERNVLFNYLHKCVI
jgi:hypothetical protein